MREEIGVHPDNPLDNAYSGNVVDICPVGALTLKEFRFKSRVWFVTNVPSTCAGCARCCSIDIGQFRNEIYRITPRENHAVNRWWICDEGRLWGERLRAAEPRRLSGPRGTLPAGSDPWAAAITSASQALRSATSAGRAAVLASPRMSLEEAWLLAKLVAGPLSGAKIFLPRHERGADDDLLLRADKSPNRRGVIEIFTALGLAPQEVSALEAALRGDQLDALLAIGPGIVGPVDDEKAVVDQGALGRVPALIVLDAHASPLSDHANMLLPVFGYAENGGTYVNFAGRVQRAERALTPRGDCRPLPLLLGELWVELGGRERLPSPAEVRAGLSNDVPSLRDIDWDALPAGTGQDLVGADAASAVPPPSGAAKKMAATGVAMLGHK